MKALSTILASVAASAAVTGGAFVMGGWTIERHIPVDAPAGVIWIENTSDGVALRAQSDLGIALETFGPSFFNGNVDIEGKLRIADGTEGAGKVLISQEDGTARWAIPPRTRDYAVFVDQKAPNEPGGNSVGGSWIVRDLNTATALSGSTITLDAATATITLEPGTYLVEASAPARDVEGHILRLRNVTTNSTALVGTTAFVDNDTADNDVTRSLLVGYVQIGGTFAEEFRLEHRTSSTSTNGLGHPANFDEVSIYSTAHIRKIN